MATTKKLWKTLSADYAIKTEHLRIRRETVQLPKGEIYDDYFINETPGWVGIFCLTNQNTVILNRQYKHGIGECVLELPAGAIDANESPETSARRELFEETGYEADTFEHLGSFIIDPTYSEGRMQLFYCEDASRARGTRPRDPREDIRNRFVSMPQLVSLLRSNKINVLGHVAAIYTVLDKKFRMLRPAGR
jgi:ADP-ribose pyrophosphatase